MAELDPTQDQPAVANPGDHEMAPLLDSAAELASLLDRYLADLQSGRAPDRERLCASHPELAGQLEACLAGIEFIHRATAPATESPTTLGEFHIIRELGRGGMGVVYEAEQTSLRRHVALKVLRFGGVTDEDAMKRFQREAETVARLHHTNIVPIFAVGCERGVHYYAMQLIAGRSLADALAESQRTGRPLPAADVAHWGLQAAEALAYAHQRGVIHRDIKPSNLLLDNDGVVWLTDFGLAKRMDEATLTVHGTLMGTPRYMSPEQAASLKQPVDRRTDLYSLGASLYELATGKPLFESAMPHLVIAQILTEEPARPRLIRPDLPRDLETVILTCLAKEPLKRYQSAQALANDLRAVIERRPIQARRAPVMQRVVRYVRRRGKTLKGAGLATAATILLMAGVFLAWRYYADWRLGRIALTTDGPPLAAELLPESADDRPISEPFDVGTRTVLTLPSGDYRLRVKARGLMSETYRVAINRGETRTHQLSLDENSLLGAEPIPFSQVTEAVALTPGKFDFIEWTGETLIRRDGSTGKPIWDDAHPTQPWSPGRDPVAAMRRLNHFGDEKPAGALVQPAPDLDGDGVVDLIWTFRGTPSVLAMSGKDGSLLWTHSADPVGPGPATSTEGGPAPGWTMGAPALADIDGDGTSDLIAELAVFNDPQPLVPEPANANRSGLAEEKVMQGRRTVVAISGRSGKELWNHVIDRESASLPGNVLDHGISYVRQSKSAFVAVVEGSTWVRLDPTTGRPRGASVELGFAPVLPLHYADLDGDGSDEVLALDPGKLAKQEPLTDPDLLAFSMETGKPLWRKKNLMSFFRPMPAVPVRDWPLAADLDGDGRAEIVVPHLGSLVSATGSSFRSCGGVRMLDGATGEERWDHPLWPGMQYAFDSLVHLLAAPDLDADGTGDLVVVSRFGSGFPYQIRGGQKPEPSWAYVDAVSGKDGRGLWHWRTKLESADTTPIHPVFWWGRGSDGWPMLVVPIGGPLAPGASATAPQFPWLDRFPPDPPVVHFLAAATGKEEHTIAGLSRPKTADLDGDGLADLWGAVDGELRAFRAHAPEPWRVLDRLHAAADFDGDGMTDVLSNDLETRRTGMTEAMESRTVIARAGRDGRILWRTQLDPWDDWVFPWGWQRAYALQSVPLPRGDLDGDGAPDVLVSKTSADSSPQNRRPVYLPLQALSGRTGRLLWPAGPLPPLDPQASGNPVIDGCDVLACDRRGSPDVLVLYNLFFRRSNRFDTQSRLARLSGRDGHVQWDVLLMEHLAGGNRTMGFVHEVADLDGDGGLEIVLLLKSFATKGPMPRELRVLSLENGETRWRHKLIEGSGASAVFATGDLDGDARPEIVVSQQTPQENEAIEVAALDGSSGEPRWSWRGEAPDWSDKSLLLRLAAFDGSGRREACVNFNIAQGRRHIAILDSQGHERIGRDLESGSVPTLLNVDLDGDGREELMFHDGGLLRACRGDLKEQWSWPTHETIREVVPASAGRPATLVLNPSLGLDGATGRPIWSGGPARSILRAGNEKDLPRVLSGPDEATVCRVAMPISSEETYRAAQGVPAKPAVFGGDPRWERPLPWVRPFEPYADPLFQLATAATLINVCIPAAILWLATRRRFWSVRLLLALPAVVAVVLAGYRLLTSLTPDRLQTPMPPWWGESVGGTLFWTSGLPIVAYSTAFVLSLVRRRWLRRVLALPLAVAILWTLSIGYSTVISLIQGTMPQPADPPWWGIPLAVAMLSMSGSPIVAFVVRFASAVVRRQWPKTGLLVARALIAAVAIWAFMLSFDLLQKPTIEYYNWSGWHHVVLWGAYAIGLQVFWTWGARSGARSAKWLARRSRADSATASTTR